MASLKLKYWLRYTFLLRLFVFLILTSPNTYPPKLDQRTMGAPSSCFSLTPQVFPKVLDHSFFFFQVLKVPWNELIFKEEKLVISFEFFFFLLIFFDDNDGFTRPTMFLRFHAFFEVFHYTSSKLVFEINFSFNLLLSSQVIVLGSILSRKPHSTALLIRLSVCVERTMYIPLLLTVNVC